VTIRKIQRWVGALLFAALFVEVVFYDALCIRALFFPGHCAALVGVSICLKG
jgi:hypothetical protein